jgi:hypothetical protein
MGEMVLYTHEILVDGETVLMEFTSSSRRRPGYTTLEACA